MNELLDKAKGFANGLLQKAQGLLCKDGYLASTVWASKDGEITPVLLHLKTDEDKDAVPVLLKELALKADFILLVSDSYIKPLKEGEMAPPSPKDCKDAIEAIMGFLYLPGETHIRTMSYVKSEHGYNFFDMGWEKSTGENPNSRFVNPYLKETHAL
jgi:hypothetical protein